MDNESVNFVEGGGFTCYQHDFTATDKDSWDKHRIETHTENGTAPCIYCGIKTKGKFEIMPDLMLKAVCQICGPINGVISNGVRRDIHD